MTHAVCVGMTGSGKIGMCIGLIEEAALDGIPSIIIDPKGDLPNLLLTFPELRPEEFAPWINEDDAQKKGLPAQTTLPGRQSSGKTDSLNGARMVSVLSACEMPQIFASTPRAATPVYAGRSVGDFRRVSC